MTKEQVNVIGRGRVWTGRDALRIGLVDELGGLYDAIDYAASNADIKEKKVLYFPKVKEDKLAEFIEQLEEKKNSSVKIESAQALPKELVESYAKLKELESLSGIQMRLPYQIIFE